jgi:hypothetical protein
LLRLPITLKEIHNTVRLHIQQITTIQTNVKALQPGTWELLTLENGWTNMSGYIPAQVRILGAGQAQVVGHIQGGSTTDGTIIGVVGSGFFNPSHLHAFTANVLAGAASVSVNGDVTGSSDDSGLADGTIQGSSTQVGLPDGTTQGNSGSASGAGSHSHGPGTYSVTNGQHTHGSSTYSIRDGHHTHGSTSLGSATPINYNTVTLTMNTSGQLVLTNCSGSASQLSFSEPLPLNTATT